MTNSYDRTWNLWDLNTQKKHSSAEVRCLPHHSNNPNNPINPINPINFMNPVSPNSLNHSRVLSVQVSECEF